jgi:hypothetical protein
VLVVVEVCAETRDIFMFNVDEVSGNSMLSNPNIAFGEGTDKSFLYAKRRLVLVAVVIWGIA